MQSIQPGLKQLLLQEPETTLPQLVHIAETPNPGAMDCQRDGDAGGRGGKFTWLLLGLFGAMVLVAGIFTASSLASWKTQVDSAAAPAPVLRLPYHLRSKRYTLTPGLLKWDHYNLTYRIVSFPRNLINESDTRKGIAEAYRMWSEVTPFHFKEVPADQESDMKIGFYGINHTDCLESRIHYCFDGTTGELAHAYFPQTGEIHFDDSEYWILGNTRFSWKKGVWLTDLVHVAAHEIGHALGLMHSLNSNALMHINATLTGKKTISQDDMWGIYSLYGCRDRYIVCASWAHKGYCDSRRKPMKKYCPYSCDFCYDFPFPTRMPTPIPPRTKVRLVPEGRNVTFTCGKKIIHKKGKVYWYKDNELLEYSYPGYLYLSDDHMSIIANAINEGLYTCIVKKRDRVLTTYSWNIRVPM